MPEQRQRSRSFLGGFMYRLIIVSIFLGFGLAMDACAVSMANGLKEPKMRIKKLSFIALLFGIFQGAMPLIGYFVGHAFVAYIEKWIPWLALILLLIIGGKMVIEGFRNSTEVEDKPLTFRVLLLQAIATSIDALSVGFTIADYTIQEACITVLMIAVITTLICVAAILIGKKFGTKLGNKAEILGGFILIAIGLEIFITGIFF